MGNPINSLNSLYLYVSWILGRESFIGNYLPSFVDGVSGCFRRSCFVVIRPEPFRPRLFTRVHYELTQDTPFTSGHPVPIEPDGRPKWSTRKVSVTIVTLTHVRKGGSSHRNFTFHLDDSVGCRTGTSKKPWKVEWRTPGRERGPSDVAIIMCNRRLCVYTLIFVFPGILPSFPEKDMTVSRRLPTFQLVFNETGTRSLRHSDLPTGTEPFSNRKGNSVRPT